MNRITLCAIFLLLVYAIPCNASWLVFHKPQFKGKIMDIETSEPIEGAVVVAIYRKTSIGIGDSVDMDFDARETLTDKDGNFRIPSYTAMIQPLSWSIPVQFVIFKPGYVCDGTLGREDDFSGTGVISDRNYAASWNSNLKYKIIKNGIVMLRKVTGKDRIESASRLSSISEFAKELPIATKMKLDENKFVLTLHR